MTKNIGAQGEYLARLFLEKKGYVFLRANYRIREGEIDLIMQDGDELCFIEVKTRTFASALAFGRGAEKIDSKKQRRIRLAAERFLCAEPRLCSGLTPRFDAVEVYLDPEEPQKVRVLHTPFAF